MVEETSVDEYDTQVYGSGYLEYEATIKIKRRVAVLVDFIFYENPEDKTDFLNAIYITGDDLRMELEGADTQRFTHQKRCYAGCE